MRIAMYWHNGRSLGHTAEIAKITHALSRDLPDAFLAGLTGAYLGLDMLPDKLDVIKIPGFANYDKTSGWNYTGRQGLDRESLFKVRAEMAEVFIKHYRPDMFLVNHVPYGAENELIPALSLEKTGLRVLTLRGVLFDRAKTNREYFEPKPAKWIADHYDAIFVHIDPEIFRLEEQYDIPVELQERIQYTGYLTRREDFTRQAARKLLMVDPDAKIVVCSMGGGQGAFEIWVNLIQGLKSNSRQFDQVYLITGPYLEASDQNALAQIAAEIPWLEVITYVSNMTVWMAASDLFIGAAGSNMLGEILSTGCNAIAIPRQVRETEQLIHSTLLAQKGILRMCDLPTVLAGQIDELIYAGLHHPLGQNNQLLLNGVDRYVEYLTHWYTKIKG